MRAGRGWWWLAAACVAGAAWGAPAAGQALDSLGRHGVALEAGRLWQGIADDLASPARYRGDAGIAGAAYRYRGTAWRLGASVARAGARLTPAMGSGPGHEEVTAMSLDGWALRRVWRSAGGRWAAYAGPALAADMGLRRHYYRLDQSTAYDNAFIGLEAAGLLEVELAGLGRVSERVMLPVAGVAVRTAYTGLAGSGPDVTVGLPPSFVLLRHRLDIRNPVSDRLVFGFLYEGTLVRHDAPLELAVAWQRLGVSLELTWGRP